MLCLVLFSFNRKHLPVSNVLQALWIFSKCSDFFFYDFLKTVPCPILLIHKKLSHKTHKFQQCGPATSRVLQPLVIMQNTQQYLQKKVIDMHITVLLVQNALFHETKV